MRSRILDVLAALFVASIFWVPPLVRTGRWAAAPLLAGVIAAILLCRRFPAWSVLAAAALTITGTALGVTTDPMTAAAWCLYPLAFGLAGRVRAPLVVLTALIGGLVVVAGVPDEDPHGLGRRLLLSVVALTLSWLLGTMVGRQVAAERARVQLTVAREVHDVVGHALGVIGAEAGVTRSLPDATDAELRESLAGIERHARGALAEVQTLVRALRTPTPTPDQLTALVTAVRSSGVRVEADLAPIADLDPPLAASLFRIAQESLSNVVRHAPGSLCRITLAQEAGTLVLTVEDNGPPPPPATAAPPTPAPGAMAAPASGAMVAPASGAMAVPASGAMAVPASGAMEVPASGAMAVPASEAVATSASGAMAAPAPEAMTGPAAPGRAAPGPAALAGRHLARRPRSWRAGRRRGPCSARRALGRQFWGPCLRRVGPG